MVVVNNSPLSPHMATATATSSSTSSSQRATVILPQQQDQTERQQIDWKDPNFGLKQITILEDMDNHYDCEGKDHFDDDDDDDDESVPDLNMHHLMEAGEWQGVVDFLYELQDESESSYSSSYDDFSSATGSEDAASYCSSTAASATTCFGNGPSDQLLNAFVVRGYNDELPLHTLVWKAPPLLAKYMIATLLPRNVARELLLTVDAQGNTPLHLACANLDESLEFSIIKEILLLVPEALEKQNNDGDSPLHLLVTSPGFRRCRDFQIEAACEEALAALLDGSTYLALAQNHTGWTLLHCALAHGAHERVLAQLLKVAPQAAHVCTQQGYLPLHLVAAFAGTPFPVARQLLEENPDGIIATTAVGDTPLHLLMSNAHKHMNEANLLDRNTTKLAELLVGFEDEMLLQLQEEEQRQRELEHRMRNVVDVSTVSSSSDEDSSNRDDNDDTISPSMEERGPLFVANQDNLYPLHCCAAFCTPPQLTRLIMSSAFAEPASELTSRFGATALHLVCASPDLKSSSSDEKRTVLDNLRALATPAACLIRDDNQRTPLVVAVQNRHASGSAVRHLCRVNPQAALLPIARNYYPLHLAVQSEHARESAVKALCKAAPETLAAVTSSGRHTPLHEACLHRASPEVVLYLVQAYPPAISERNKDGKKPVALARGSGFPGSLIDVLWGSTRLERSQRKSLLNDIGSAGSNNVHDSQHKRASAV